MLFSKSKNQRGAALLLYLIILTFFIALLMTTTYSRLLLSLKRAESSTDAITASYRSESEVFDVLARLSGGYLTQNPLNIYEVKQDGSTKLTIKGSQAENVQTVTVSVDKPFASSQIVGTRTLDTITQTSQSNIEIMLALDCTGSMDSAADSLVPGGPTRFDALENAATKFVDTIASRSDSSKFKVGVSVFAIDHKWLSYKGQNVSIESGLSLSDVSMAIHDGFSSRRADSSACIDTIGGTSVGTPFAFLNDYLKGRKSSSTKQIEIVITDGIPNSRIPYAGCAPSYYCPGSNLPTCTSNKYGWTCPSNASEPVCTTYGIDFLRCTVADNKTKLPNSTSYGVRDPDINAYAVTILGTPTSSEIASFNSVVNIFNTYLGASNYYNAKEASSLSSILDAIYTDIISKHETITIKKVTPGT